MRAERAKALFREGYNCSQAVFVSCCDLYGITDEQLALRLSASFGGGIGRMRMTCGAACGMFMLAGLERGQTRPHDPDAKMHNYELVQALAGEYKRQFGSLVCAELLGLAPKTEASDNTFTEHLDPRPEARTEAYYHKRPCPEMIAEAVRIYLRSL